MHYRTTGQTGPQAQGEMIMFTQSEYVANQMNRDAYDRAFQEAQNLRKLREAGLLQPSPLTRAVRHSAGRLGHVLVALGRSLERIDRASNPTFTTTGCD